MSKPMPTDEMPDRYKPDPWMDSRCAPRPRGEAPAIQVPRTVLSVWVDAERGDSFGFAPCGPQSVWFGRTVPRWLDSGTVTRPPSQNKLRLWVRKPVVYYLGVTHDEPIRFHRPDRRGWMKLEVLPEDEVDA